MPPTHSLQLAPQMPRTIRKRSRSVLSSEEGCIVAKGEDPEPREVQRQRVAQPVERRVDRRVGPRLRDAAAGTVDTDDAKARRCQCTGDEELHAGTGTNVATGGLGGWYISCSPGGVCGLCATRSGARNWVENAEDAIMPRGAVFAI